MKQNDKLLEFLELFCVIMLLPVKGNVVRPVRA